MASRSTLASARSTRSVCRCPPRTSRTLVTPAGAAGDGPAPEDGGMAAEDARAPASDDAVHAGAPPGRHRVWALVRRLPFTLAVVTVMLVLGVSTGRRAPIPT